MFRAWKTVRECTLLSISPDTSVFTNTFVLLHVSAADWYKPSGSHCTYQEARGVVQQAAKPTDEAPLQEGGVFRGELLGVVGDQRGAAVRLHVCGEHTHHSGRAASTRITIFTLFSVFIIMLSWLTHHPRKRRPELDLT